MSILATELIAYGSASRPTDDTSTTGGAIDAKARPVFTQFTANAKLALISTSASDTGNVTIVGRDAGGAVVSETIALTGTTEKLSTNTYERIQSVTTAADMVGTLSLKQGTGGTVIATIPVGERNVHALFLNSSSGASIATRYEKIFWYNKNATLTLNTAAVMLTADPSAKIKIGLATAKGDSVTVANRTTAPGSVTFVDDSVSQSIPGGTLEAVTGIGVWIQQTLAANDAPLKSTFTTQLSGTTT